MHQLLGSWPCEVLPACQISDWMWSEKDAEILVGDCLKPVRSMLGGKLRGLWDAWLTSIVFDEWYG